MGARHTCAWNVDTDSGAAKTRTGEHGASTERKGRRRTSSDDSLVGAIRPDLAAGADGELHVLQTLVMSADSDGRHHEAMLRVDELRDIQSRMRPDCTFYTCDKALGRCVWAPVMRRCWILVNDAKERRWTGFE